MRGNVVDGDLKKVVAGLKDVCASRKSRVAVSSGVHEVIGDQADGVRWGDRGFRASDAVWRPPDAVDNRGGASTVVGDPKAGDLWEAPGGNGWVTFRREAIQQSIVKLLPGKGENDCAVTEGQD